MRANSGPVRKGRAAHGISMATKRTHRLCTRLLLLLFTFLTPSFFLETVQDRGTDGSSPHFILTGILVPQGFSWLSK